MRPALNEFDQLLEPLDPATLLVAEAMNSLGDDWTVLTRPRLGLDIIDFLVIHGQRGVCAISVVDWTPGSRRVAGDGVLHEIDASGAARSVVDSPRFAAHRHRNNIFDRSFALPSDGTEPTTAVRAAVIAPLLSDAEATQLLDPRHHDDAQRHVEVWGSDSLRTQLERIVVGVGCDDPFPQSVERVRRLVAASERPAERTAPAARSANSYEIEVNPDEVPIRRFRGAAGSGKSFGLTARAARLASQGRRVLVLSFNVTLANRLSALVVERCREYGANPTNVTCTNFHSYCTRIVQDAEIFGHETSAPKGARWTQAIVSKALTALEAGFDDRYDAILIDEGQDFTLRWWNLLHTHALAPGGEMLLMVDPTLDLYERNSWADDAALRSSGFDQPWIQLTGSYRMPNDLMKLAGAFAAGHLAGDRLVPSIAPDHDEVAGPMVGTTRRWYTIDQIGEMGLVIGLEVVRLLRENPSLSPGDVTFLCDYHHDGVAAAREIEAAGYRVHHIFSRDPDDARRRRKYRFSPVASAVKGSTIHSFKGWETPALVMGIGVESRSKRGAYAAMTRVVGSPDRPAVISVVSADQRLDGFRSEFVAGSVPTPTARPTPASSPSPADGLTSPAPAPAPAPAPDELVWAEPNRPLSEPSQPDGVVTNPTTVVATPARPSHLTPPSTPDSTPSPTPLPPPPPPAPVAAPTSWDAPPAPQRRG